MYKSTATILFMEFGRPRIGMKELASVLGLSITYLNNVAASAALAHFRYCPATSINFSVVAPKESSLSGVKSGQLATTSGLGFASGDGGIDALQAVSIMATVTINRFLMDFFLQCLPDGRLLDLDLGNGFRCAALGVVAHLSGKLQHFGLICAGNRPAIRSALDVRAAHRQQKRQRPDQPNLRAKH
jgi:hypothetical protein